MQVLPKSGHAVHEDVPEQVCQYNLFGHAMKIAVLMTSCLYDLL